MIASMSAFRSLEFAFNARSASARSPSAGEASASRSLMTGYLFAATNRFASIALSRRAGLLITFEVPMAGSRSFGS